MEKTVSEKENINEINGEEEELIPGTGENPVITLYELVFGIVFAGIAGQLIEIAFHMDADVYIGWWTGVLTAVFMSIHMFFNIKKLLDYSEADAQTEMKNGAMLRYAIAAIVMIIAFLSGYANPVAYVLGIIMLKAGAYLQPVTHSLSKRFFK